MKEKIRKLLPEIEWIEDKDLQEKVVASYEDALKTGGWQPEDMDKIPFTLLIPDGCSGRLWRGFLRAAEGRWAA